MPQTKSVIDREFVPRPDVRRSDGRLPGLLMSPDEKGTKLQLPQKKREQISALGPYDDLRKLFPEGVATLADGTGSNIAAFGVITHLLKDNDHAKKVVEAEADDEHPVNQISRIISQGALAIMSAGDKDGVPWMEFCQATGVPGVAAAEGIGKNEDAQTALVIDPEIGPAVVIIDPKEEQLKEWGFEAGKPGAIVELGRKREIKEYDVLTEDGMEVAFSRIDNGIRTQDGRIGLLRTEYTRLVSEKIHDLEKDMGEFGKELTMEYDLAMQTSGEHEFNARLFDLNSDKYPKNFSHYLGERFLRGKDTAAMLEHEKYRLIATEQVKALLMAGKRKDKEVGIIVPTVQSVDDVKAVKTIISSIPESERGRYRLIAEVETQAGLDNITDISDEVDAVFIGTSSLVDEKKARGDRAAVGRDEELDIKVLNPLGQAVKRMWEHTAQNGREDFDLRIVGKLNNTRTGILMGLGILSHFADGRRKVGDDEHKEHKIKPRFVVCNNRIGAIMDVVRGVNTETVANVAEQILDGNVLDGWNSNEVKVMTYEHVYKGNDDYFPNHLDD